MTEEQFNEWLKTQPIEDKLVYLKYKYAHESEWTFSNEILEVEMSVDGYYVWSHDWDEGQQDVEILGCIAISDIDVPVFTQADTPQTERKCIDCRYLTYMYGKTWCNIKCDNPHDKVCDRFKPNDEQTETQIETQNSNLTFEKSDCPWK